MIIGLILLVVIALGLFFYFNKNKKVEDVVVRTTEEKEKDFFEKDILSLININLKARLSIMDQSILSLLEETIDSIRTISEEMNKDKNFSENSVMFSRMIDRYLPELVMGYSKLSEKDQETQKDSFMDSLNVLKNEVSEIEDELSNSSSQDFEKTGKLISAMFNKIEGEV